MSYQPTIFEQPASEPLAARLRPRDLRRRPYEQQRKTYAEHHGKDTPATFFLYFGLSVFVQGIPSAMRLTRFFNSSGESMTTLPQPRHLILKSAPVRTISHNFPPQGCGFLVSTTVCSFNSLRSIPNY